MSRPRPFVVQWHRCLAVFLPLIALALLAAPARAQNQSYTIAPGGSIDIQYTGGGHWYFETNPTPSTASMSRLDSSKVSEYPWGGTTANGNFYDDVPNNSENRIYSGEYLRVHGGSTPAGQTITIAYDTSPILQGQNPNYTISIAVQIPGAQVTSLNITDPSPTAANVVHWQAVFDHPITGVTAANFSFTNSANITPAPSVTNVAPTNAGDNTAWTVTASTGGTGTGILSLNWVGHVSESPSVPNQFSGQEYQFSSYPLVTTEPVANAYAAVNTTPPTLTCTATSRTGATMNYQWKAGSSTNPNAATTISGATQQTYTPPPSGAVGTAYYYCTTYTNANNSYYNTDSTTTTLNFETPPSITSTGGNVYGLNNTGVSLAVNATGTYVQYQWYQGSSGDTTHPVSNATSSQFTTPALTTNTNYWAQVFDSHLGGSYNRNGTTQTAYVMTNVSPVNGGLTATVNGAFSGPMEITITDSQGNAVHGATVVFTIPSATKVTFQGGQTTFSTTTDTGGDYKSTALTAGTLAGSFSAPIQAYSSTGSTVSTGNGLAVSPGPASKLAFVTGAPSTATAGVAFSPAPVLELQDAYANVLTTSGLSISVARSTGTGALGGTTSISTAANGSATFSNLTYTVAETMTFQASYNSLTATSGNIAVSHGAGVLAAVTGSGQTAAPGSAFSTPLKAHFADTYGNVISGAGVVFTVPSSGASATMSGTTTTDASGNVSVTATANATPGVYTISANSNPASNAVSFALENFTQLQYWRFVNFSGDFQGSGNDADTASPHGDGVANLLKYAFDLNPAAADATPMTTTGIKGLPLVGQDGSGHLTLTFVRRKSSTNPAITYQPQFSSNLASGTFAANASATTGTPVSIDGTWERVTVTDSVVAGTGQLQRFARVYISDP